MSLPGIEPGALSVLDSRDNHYTTETTCYWKLMVWHIQLDVPTFRNLVDGKQKSVSAWN